MTEGRREQHPSKTLLEITRVSKDIQKQNCRGQEGGTSKQKTVRNQKGGQRHSKTK